MTTYRIGGRTVSKSEFDADLAASIADDDRKQNEMLARLDADPSLVCDVFYSMWEHEGGHPQEVMRDAGIAYEEAIPKPIGDCWQFLGCRGVTSKAPKAVSVSNVRPR